MKHTSHLITLAFIFILSCVFAVDISAQTSPETPRRVNFGYSQNPKTKNKNVTPENGKPIPATFSSGKSSTSDGAIAKSDAPLEQNAEQNTEVKGRSVASKTLDIVKRANVAAASPTEIYKTGIGDILFISLQNAPAKDSTYFTVLNDGTIDYPLAGEMIQVAGLTAEEIEDLLKEKVKLYENPQISVKVREHASHSITVLGLVEKAGEKFLQREAMPLYVVKAEAIVQSRADQVFIKRANATTESFDLKDSKSEDILIFPGDILEFKSTHPFAENSSATQFYFIGGEIVSGGQKDFHPGITLTQAILASGGLRKSGFKKVIIRRKNDQGLLSTIEFDLHAIKDGKQPDPQIQSGDTLEIVKN